MADGAWMMATANIAGMTSECGNLSLMSARPDKDVVIVSVAQHGLFASVDNAADWARLGSGPGSEFISNRGASIVYDPAHAGTFWESGTYNGPGAYKTTDDGHTFTKLGDATHADVISVDFTDPERKTMVYAGHEQFASLRRSRDGGQTWEKIGASLEMAVGWTSIPHVLDANTFLVGTINGQNGKGGILRSTDGGQTWTQVHSNAGVNDRPLVAADGSIYWGLFEGLIRSTDKGATWTKVSGHHLVRGWPSLDELPDGRLMAIGDKNILVSADHGATWRAIAPELPFQPNGAVYARFRKAIYIWRWTCANDPIAADQIMKLPFDHAAHP